LLAFLANLVRVCDMLEVRRMRILREVAARGGISAAAEAMGYTHSAVSQQLQALERECGTPLLRRRGRGVALTDAARVLVDHTEPVLAALERAEAALAASTHGVAGRLRVGSFPTANRSILPGALAALRAGHPDLELILEEVEPDDSLPALKIGDLDVALAHEYDLLAPRRDPSLHREELASEPMFAVGGPQGVTGGRPEPARAADGPAATARGRPAQDPGADRALGARDGVRLRDLAGADWILPAPDSACAEQVQRACHAAGFQPRAVARTGDFAVAAALAEAGAGVTLIPRLGLPERRLAVPVRPVADPPLRRRIFAAVRAGAETRPAVAATLAALRAAT
jgi:DNA-binding transcriptional LysR family regulator